MSTPTDERTPLLALEAQQKHCASPKNQEPRDEENGAGNADSADQNGDVKSPAKQVTMIAVLLLGILHTRA